MKAVGPSQHPFGSPGQVCGTCGILYDSVVPQFEDAKVKQQPWGTPKKPKWMGFFKGKSDLDMDDDWAGIVDICEFCSSTNIW